MHQQAQQAIRSKEMIKENALAKITWRDPRNNDLQEFVLTEGAMATIGRAAGNDIYIPEEHVSRQHAIIKYQDGIFMITDLGSANGTFVNDEPLTEPYPLFSGDRIRLFVPELEFSAVVTDEEKEKAHQTGRLITVAQNTGKSRLIITNGPQEGETIMLHLKEVTVGRATSNATWEIALQDPSVSRPHAKLKLDETTWIVYDLGSSNGTTVNDVPVTEKGRSLNDGDIIAFGTTQVLFRVG